MAFDAMAGYIYELNTDVFADTIPDTYQTFLEVLEEYEITTDALGTALDCADLALADDALEDGDYDRIESAYKQVQRMFEAKTGLEIALSTIDPGSAHNEVVGPTWCVLNAVQLTPAAQRLGDNITQKFFCHFG